VTELVEMVIGPEKLMVCTPAIEFDNRTASMSESPASRWSVRPVATW
jgi:hypothetical protein